MKPLSIDELNNMTVQQLKNLEDELWEYRKKVVTVLTFQKAIEEEI